MNIDSEFTDAIGKASGAMDEAEARQYITWINQHADAIGRLLLEFRDREGWRALGYPSWTQFLEGYELEYSRKRLLEFMRAFPVTVSLREKGYPVNTEQALALSKFQPDMRVPIYEMVVNHGKGVTADRLIAAGQVMTEIVATGGYVTTEDGVQRAANSAYSGQRREGEIGKRHYLAQNDPVCIVEIDEYGIVTQPIILSLTDIKRVQVGQTVRVSVWIEEAEA